MENLLNQSLGEGKIMYIQQDGKTQPMVIYPFISPEYLLTNPSLPEPDFSTENMVEIELDGNIHNDFNVINNIGRKVTYQNLLSRINTGYKDEQFPPNTKEKLLYKYVESKGFYLVQTEFILDYNVLSKDWIPEQCNCHKSHGSFGGHFILTFSNGRKEVIDTGRVYNENLYLVKIDPNDNSVDKISDDMDKASIGIMNGSIFKEIDSLLNKLKELSTKGDDKLKIH